MTLLYRDSPPIHFLICVFALFLEQGKRSLPYVFFKDAKVLLLGFSVPTILFLLRGRPAKPAVRCVADEDAPRLLRLTLRPHPAVARSLDSLSDRLVELISRERSLQIPVADVRLVAPGLKSTDEETIAVFAQLHRPLV